MVERIKTVLVVGATGSIGCMLSTLRMKRDSLCARWCEIVPKRGNSLKKCS
ncbi:MAG: hypothetical protein ABSF70_11705 [Terracidiphilus sp.]